MKKAAVAAAGIFTAITLLAGCRKEDVEKVIEPLVAEVKEEEEAETIQEIEDDSEEESVEEDEEKTQVIRDFVEQNVSPSVLPNPDKPEKFCISSTF